MRAPRRQRLELSWPLLGAGLGVTAAVWALLDLNRHLVGHTVDGQVTKAWIAARQVAQNTQALHILNATQERAHDLVAELEQHRDLMGGSRA